MNCVVTGAPIEFVSPYEGKCVKMDASWFHIMHSTAWSVRDGGGGEELKKRFLTLLMDECQRALDTVESGGAG